jgi:hypothetical protein
MSSATGSPTFSSVGVAATSRRNLPTAPANEAGRSPGGSGRIVSGTVLLVSTNVRDTIRWKNPPTPAGASGNETFASARTGPSVNSPGWMAWSEVWYV